LQCVTLALEVVGLHKGFRTGFGSCWATNAVLRGIDLELARGEVVAIAGDAGSGRSTLLLCLAGLLRADRGIVRWFGDESRDAAVRCTRHYLTAEQLGWCDEPPDLWMHLVDLRDFTALSLGRLRPWLAERARRGDAALVVADSLDVARHLTARILILRDGRLHETSRAQSRVAERHFVDPSFERI
jgi:ABC-type dipeptide/oligopeptide/nickel transport system ATPase subunit